LGTILKEYIGYSSIIFFWRDVCSDTFFYVAQCIAWVYTGECPIFQQYSHDRTNENKIIIENMVPLRQI
jgi:hypothetical protein